MFDATYFGRDYGFLCFSDGKKIIYFQEIKTENLEELEKAINALLRLGYRFKSFTLDGKKGYIKYLENRFPQIPIQMCVFHQKAIIRRHITNNPKSACGKDLQSLMMTLKSKSRKEFENDFYNLQKKYNVFLKERNEKGDFMHERLRAAFRSIKTNLPNIFIYKDYSDLNISSTTNQLEGVFSHLKEKIRIHRGMSLKRKKKAIRFFLKNF